MMLDYTVLLHGFRGPDDGLPGALFRDLLDVLHDSARGSVRLRLAGTSDPGSVPEWVDEAASFLVTGFTRDGPGITLRVPYLADVLPREIVRSDHLRDLDPEQTALNLMSQSLCEALGGHADSDAYDEPLLDTFEEFGRVLHHGVEAMEIRNGRAESPGVVLTLRGLDVVRRLHDRTPSPRRVRLAGRIIMVNLVSGPAFGLALESGEIVRGVLVKKFDPRGLSDLLGKIAVVSGLARFRPSGRLLRVDADGVAPGTPKDLEIWSVMPRPLDGQFHVREVRQPQGPDTGINAIIGKWPGDETDEEIFRLLEEMS